jgi:HEAT repeat protein
MRLTRFTRFTGSALFVALASLTLAAQDWPGLIAQLRDANAERRIDALRQLNIANYVAAAPYAAPLLTDPVDQVQSAAIDAELTFFLNEPVGPGSSGSRALEAFNAGPLVRAAGREPEVLVDQLITATADRNARVRFDAMHALGVIAEPGSAAATSAEATRRVMAGLQQPDPVFRAATARVLGRLRATAAGDALIGLLNDRSELVVQFAVESLGWIRTDRAVQALMDRAAYFGTGDRANQALLALARIGHGGARNLLRSHLADPDPAARRAAVEGLGRMNDRASLELMRRLAQNDPSNEVRLAGLFALSALGEPQAAGIALVVGPSPLGDQARDYLLEIGAPAAPSVAAAMTTTADPLTRAALTHLIGFIGGPSNIAALETMTRDADPRAARAAADALARLRR